MYVLKVYSQSLTVLLNSISYSAYIKQRESVCCGGNETVPLSAYISNPIPDLSLFRITTKGMFLIYLSAFYKFSSW
jgi:hypothetical protein